MCCVPIENKSGIHFLSSKDGQNAGGRMGGEITFKQEFFQNNKREEDNHQCGQLSVRTIVSVDNFQYGQLSVWTIVSVDNCQCGRLSARTIGSADNCQVEKCWLLLESS